MGVIDTISGFLDGPETGTTERSKGAYWCDDCNERIRDVDAEPDEEPPGCPSCGEGMRFERSPDSGGCAC